MCRGSVDTLDMVEARAGRRHAHVSTAGSSEKVVARPPTLERRWRDDMHTEYYDRYVENMREGI